MDAIGPWHPGTRTDADDPAHDTLRQEALYGTLFAGGAGVEWYFGWHKPPNDLNAEDWRSRENMWKQTNIARQVFSDLPLTQTKNCNALLNIEDGYCFGLEGSVYAIYLKDGGEATIDLTSEETKEFRASWVNPRSGEETQVDKVITGPKYRIGMPPEENDADWLIILRRDM